MPRREGGRQRAPKKYNFDDELSDINDGNEDSFVVKSMNKRRKKVESDDDFDINEID